MAEPNRDDASRLQEYRQRLDGLMDAAREGIERQAPDILDKAAATARNIAQRLDEMASDARERAAKGEATAEPAGAPDRPPEPDRPPASDAESRTAGP